MLVPSGTMGNLISVLSHCGRGDEMILGDLAHIFLYEQGGAAALGGVQPRPRTINPTARLTSTQILPTTSAATTITIRSAGWFVWKTRKIAVADGYCWPDYVDAVGDPGVLCQALKLHVDGARLVNAAVALQVFPPTGWWRRQTASVSALARGWPRRVGSVVVGSAGIHQAGAAHAQTGGRRDAPGRRFCRRLCLVPPHEMIDRLAEDHAPCAPVGPGSGRD